MPCIVTKACWEEFGDKSMAGAWNTGAAVAQNLPKTKSYCYKDASGELASCSSVLKATMAAVTVPCLSKQLFLP